MESEWKSRRSLVAAAVLPLRTPGAAVRRAAHATAAVAPVVLALGVAVGDSAQGTNILPGLPRSATDGVIAAPVATERRVRAPVSDGLVKSASDTKTRWPLCSHCSVLELCISLARIALERGSLDDDEGQGEEKEGGLHGRDALFWS